VIGDQRVAKWASLAKVVTEKADIFSYADINRARPSQGWNETIGDWLKMEPQSPQRARRGSVGAARWVWAKRKKNEKEESRKVRKTGKT
jgi:hypothetical protein